MTEVDIDDDKIWADHVAKFQVSGLSARQFCRNENLKYHVFLNKLREARSGKSKGEKNGNSPIATPEFYKLELSGMKELPCNIGRIQFPNGLSLELDSLPDANWLSKLGGLRP